MKHLQDLPSWKALWEHFYATKGLHMREMFVHDADRAQRYWLETGGIVLDYSKNRITDETLNLLLKLACEAGLVKRIKQMFGGEKINYSEDRAVLHTALRNRTNVPVKIDGKDVMLQINDVLRRMGSFTHEVRSGRWRGYTGRVITDVVSIGVGGSVLGSLMMCTALKPFGHPRIRMHFVSSVSGLLLQDVLKELNPETTLFVVVSKTFTTQETLTNALVARDWLLNHAGSKKAMLSHFVAVSGNQKAVAEFGIDAANIFEFWDWVGGRYSLWSAAGLPVMLFLGEENFIDMLDGAHLMDRHFFKAPFAQNMPVLLAVIGIWYINYYGSSSHVIAPYAQYLHYLPQFIRQLDMESNGKQIALDSRPVTYKTAPVTLGETGINGQHTFFQLLHQGTYIIPVDFIASLEKYNDLLGNHEMLLANMFAQAEALMCGKTMQEIRSELEAQNMGQECIEKLLPHKMLLGNRPSNIILLSRINPYNMGSLIALYEHKTFVQGVIWGINSFDQWGVELGKQFSKIILDELTGKTGMHKHDSSTERLIRLYRNAN